MAWNEPGGGRDRDPWGGRGGDQGPPDLDEAFRKLQERLSGIFGGGGSGGGETSGWGFNPIVAVILLALVLAGYVAAGVYTIDEQERGVVFRFGEVQDQVMMPGLRWRPPIVDRVEVVNVTRVNDLEHQALVLTRDENIIDINITVQYVVDDPVRFVTQVRQPINSLSQATESALRHVVGDSSLDQAITEGRAAMGLSLRERLQSYVDLYGSGIRVSTVNIDQSGPPSAVQEAFDAVQMAQEEEQRIVNEARAYADEIIPEARGEAQRQIEAANAYRDRVIARAQGEANRFMAIQGEYAEAPEVTRSRLYLDAMERVLTNSSKVYVDVDGGNNLLYLPLDRMGQRGERQQQLVQPRSLEQETDGQREEEPSLLRRESR